MFQFAYGFMSPRNPRILHPGWRYLDALKSLKSGVYSEVYRSLWVTVLVSKRFVMQVLGPTSFPWFLRLVLCFLTQAVPPQCDAILLSSWHWKPDQWSHPISSVETAEISIYTLNKHLYIKARLPRVFHYINDKWFTKSELSGTTSQTEPTKLHLYN